MRKLILLLTLLITVSCSKEEDNDVIADCNCIEEIYEHNFITTPNGQEVNTGDLLDIKDNLPCQTSRNEARTNNDYPDSDSSLLWVVVRCN